MANQLIDQSRLARQRAATDNNDRETQMAKQQKNERCFLYRDDVPAGRIFDGPEAIAAAREDGWKDTPPKGLARAQAAPGADSRAAEADAKIAALTEELAGEKKRNAELEEALAEAEGQVEKLTEAQAAGKGKGGKGGAGK